MFGSRNPILKRPEWKSDYDAVIIGGGIHGLAAAYYLAKEHGIKNTAVLEQGEIGCGASGLSAGVVHINKRTPESIRLYSESMKLWSALSRKLGVNLMFSRSGILTLAHSEDDMYEIELRAASAALQGVKVDILSAQECRHRVLALDISGQARHPVTGGMFHPQGGAVSPDAAVWGLTQGAARLGADIHRQTEVTGIGTEGGRITCVQTSKGTVQTPMVLNAAGADAGRICRMIGLEIPLLRHRVEAAVMQPLKPLVKHVLLSGVYPCNINQNLKGEIISRGTAVPSQDDRLNASPEFLHSHIWAMTQLLPCIKGVQLKKSYAGLVDMTPDASPILDGNLPVQGFFMSCGWGDDGFSAGPVSGKYMASFMSSGRKPELLKPFELDRFRTFRFSGEKRQVT